MASCPELAKSELAPSTFNQVPSQLLLLVCTSGGLGRPPVVPPRDYETEPNLATTLPTALATMWPIMWAAGSPAILSLTRPPSLIINTSTPGGGRSWHTLGLVERHWLPLPPLGLFLPPPPYLTPVHMVFLSGIPSLRFTRPKPQTN